MGHLRHCLSNTDIHRSTDRSTLTDRQQLRELAVNTEPKIMYSKDVGDYDVRGENERYRFDEEEVTWRSLSKRPATFERGFQTDLSDTKRELGYIDRRLRHDEEDVVEEQRQEIITFRLPLVERTTEETYETTITTETKQNSRQIEETHTRPKPTQMDTSTSMKSELTEWTRSLGSHGRISSTDRQKRRPKSPEELVEESYEVVSTLTKPKDGHFLVTGTSPRVASFQRSANVSTSKLQSSEEDSSYREEWRVTDTATGQSDGQTAKMAVDR